MGVRTKTRESQRGSRFGNGTVIKDKKSPIKAQSIVAQPALKKTLLARHKLDGVFSYTITRLLPALCLSTQEVLSPKTPLKGL